MPDLSHYSQYTICVIATAVIGWWLWRSWRDAG